MNLGERLRAIRKSRDFTLQKIHERSGISIATLSEWENNNRKPTIKSLTRWATSVGIDFWDIFFEYPSEFTPTVEEIDMLVLFRQLAMKDQEHILAILKLMAKKH
ncbi:helix-turn-helix domain-containing protein [Paenibacillus anaericanus]|uniref:helix-turn-helix domain-containing protein n=1 Tax=Paenibacillus anaericanus TaxID=170367 RepID=UPI0014774834|nr:helix-turn-helix transcriptional regulator [Paenibacillus anaericanus]